MSDSLWLQGLLTTRVLCPWGFSMKEYWRGLPFPPQGTFQTQGLNPGLLINLDFVKLVAMKKKLIVSTFYSLYGQCLLKCQGAVTFSFVVKSKIMSFYIFPFFNCAGTCYFIKNIYPLCKLNFCHMVTNIFSQFVACLSISLWGLTMNRCNITKGILWARVRSQSCFYWLYRASQSLAAKNTINMVLILTIWWCPCVESSLVLLEEGVCYEQWVLLAKLY